MVRRAGRADPAMTEYVQARVDRLLASAPPRRARPAATIPLPEPSDDPGPSADVNLPGRRSPRGSPDPGPQTPAAGPDQPDPPDAPGPPVPGPPDSVPWWGRAGEFVRSHLVVVVGVVAALAVIVSGYAVLRARPLPLTLPALAQPGPSAGPTVPGGTPRPPTGTASGPGSPSGSASSSAGVVVVHVLGAVRRPGVVELVAGSRVGDAIGAAGGLRGDAAPDDLNLAQVLLDGQQVLVGTRGDPGGVVRGGGSGPAGSAASPGSADATAQTAPLDLNTATAAQLEELPGVGPVTAASILAWREQHGRFSRIEELQEIDGIGPKTYARLAPHVRVG